MPFTSLHMTHILRQPQFLILIFNYYVLTPHFSLLMYQTCVYFLFPYKTSIPWFNWASLSFKNRKLTGSLVSSSLLWLLFLEHRREPQRLQWANCQSTPQQDFTGDPRTLIQREFASKGLEQFNLSPQCKEEGSICK
jgi:hypothetical protein